MKFKISEIEGVVPKKEDCGAQGCGCCAGWNRAIDQISGTVVEVSEEEIFKALRKHCNENGIGALDIHLHGLALELKQSLPKILKGVRE